MRCDIGLCRQIQQLGRRPSICKKPAATANLVANISNNTGSSCKTSPIGRVGSTQRRRRHTSTQLLLLPRRADCRPGCHGNKSESNCFLRVSSAWPPPACPRPSIVSSFSRTDAAAAGTASAPVWGAHKKPSSACVSPEFALSKHTTNHRRCIQISNH